LASPFFLPGCDGIKYIQREFHLKLKNGLQSSNCQIQVNLTDFAEFSDLSQPDSSLSSSTMRDALLIDVN